ncbi:hypothetical protein BLNAU_22073 [Blattamonas nauphoetae]|uniref:Uncharacterized protein n=1 Tax=Blattamonas nauphoetae TaxID=2049346 RepID=A0ABQ9WU53_9EUKA|nr:hypothetical protein BLNAU_22073 [Blattamonas nauphoetae]
MPIDTTIVAEEGFDGRLAPLHGTLLGIETAANHLVALGLGAVADSETDGLDRRSLQIRTHKAGEIAHRVNRARLSHILRVRARPLLDKKKSDSLEKQRAVLEIFKEETRKREGMKRQTFFRRGPGQGRFYQHRTYTAGAQPRYEAQRQPYAQRQTYGQTTSPGRRAQQPPSRPYTTRPKGTSTQPQQLFRRRSQF